MVKYFLITFCIILFFLNTYQSQAGGGFSSAEYNNDLNKVEFGFTYNNNETRSNTPFANYQKFTIIFNEIGTDDLFDCAGNNLFLNEEFTLTGNCSINVNGSLKDGEYKFTIISDNDSFIESFEDRIIVSHSKLKLGSSGTFGVDENNGNVTVTFGMTVENFYENHKAEGKAIAYYLNSSMNSDQCNNVTKIQRVSVDLGRIEFICSLSSRIYKRSTNDEYEFDLAILDNSKNLFLGRTEFSAMGLVQGNEYSNDQNYLSGESCTKEVWRNSLTISHSGINIETGEKLKEILGKFYDKVENKFTILEDQILFYNTILEKIDLIKTTKTLSKNAENILHVLTTNIDYRINEQESLFECNIYGVDLDDLLHID